MADVADRALRTPVIAILGLLLASAGIHQLATGILMGVVPVELVVKGFSATVVGWVATGNTVGFLIGCIAAAPLITQLGVRRAMLVLTAVNAGAALALWLTPDPIAWTVVRGLAGFCSACVLIALESWLSATTPASRRGLVFGLYMVMTRLAFVLGQIALALVEPQFTLLFAAAAVCYLLAPWIMFAIPGAPPKIGAKTTASLRDMPVKAPAAAAAAFVHGLIITAGPGLFPVYAAAKGLPLDQIAILLAAIPFGGLILQLPLSLLSDKLGRRTVMILSALATAVISLAYLHVPPLGLWPLAVLTALWGGAPIALYALAIAHANDIATDAERLGWSSAIMFTWGLGATVGPLAASTLMDRYGADCLFWFTGALATALALFLMVRRLVRKRPLAPRPAGETIGPAPGSGG
jgi:MFS family permease